MMKYTCQKSLIKSGEWVRPLPYVDDKGHVVEFEGITQTWTIKVSGLRNKKDTGIYACSSIPDWKMERCKNEFQRKVLVSDHERCAMKTLFNCLKEHWVGDV